MWKTSKHDIQLEWEQVDILINNAGVFPERVMVQEMDIAEWDQTIRHQRARPFLIIRAVLKPMLERDFGRVLNVSAPLKHYPRAPPPTVLPSAPSTP
jgi:NADP-dependent 3-hydroxy acid dehydrogenase YdfG